MAVRQKRQIGFPLRSPTVLLQGLLAAQLKADKPQAGHVRLPLQVCQSPLGRGESLKAGYLFPHQAAAISWAGQLFVPPATAHKDPSTWNVFPLLLGWPQKFPPGLQSQSPVPAAPRDPWPHSLLGSKQLPLPRCLRCTYRGTCPAFCWKFLQFP